jgi:hypothetical protein
LFRGRCYFIFIESCRHVLLRLSAEFFGGTPEVKNDDLDTVERALKAMNQGARWWLENDRPVERPDKGPRYSVF